MKASKIEYNQEKRIKVEFPHNQEITLLLKQIPGTKWSQTIKAWHQKGIACIATISN